MLAIKVDGEASFAAYNFTLNRAGGNFRATAFQENSCISPKHTPPHFFS